MAIKKLKAPRKKARHLSIQIQLNRAKKMSLPEVLILAKQVGSKKRLVDNYSVQKGQSRGPYVNLLFLSKNLKKLWKLLREKLYKHDKHGAFLAKATIVCCEGNRGWDDYALLYHYNPKQNLDRLK